MPGKGSGSGFAVEPAELDALVATLGEVADAISGLLRSADRLGQRSPQLGTAPPALALADRLRATAGRAGLTGELGTAESELRGYHRSLVSALADYLDVDATVSSTVEATAATLGTATDMVGGLLQ